jgi:hypothetical protein
LLFILSLCSCERGCAREWLGERGVGPSASVAAAPMNAVDCPDGLARCEEGVVEGSRLASIPQPCKGLPKDCACPWDRLGSCGAGCVVNDAELVVDRGHALAQLCAPSPDAGTYAAPPPTDIQPTTACDEGDTYACSGGLVVACQTNAVVARCVRGCFAPGAGVGDDLANREAAVALLCSR